MNIQSIRVTKSNEECKANEQVKHRKQTDAIAPTEKTMACSA